ncbi:MAG: nitrile hydratase accessory protein [Dehalococcoidia bacterium]
MTAEPAGDIRQMEGEAAPPLKNGELVFEEPWESRAFGIAVALEAQGAYPWRDFRDELVEEIAHADSHGETTTYYQRWLEALESLLLKKGLISAEDLAARHEEYASGLHDEDGHIH